MEPGGLPEEGTVFRLKRGYDIRIIGEAKQEERKLQQAPRTYALKPPDFPGLSPLPKLHVREGEVKAGTPIFWDKNFPGVDWVAPVSGEIVEIRRGKKRAILEIVILADKEIDYVEFPREDPSGLSAERIRERLLKSGLWTYLIQRPWGIVAHPERKPQVVLISAFDTAPLAPDIDFLLEGNEEDFEWGLRALRTLVGETPIFLCLSADRQHNDVLLAVDGVRRYWFSGPHPSGNPGIQLHHIFPVYRSDRLAWTIRPHHLVYWGRLFRKGIVDLRTKIAVAGCEVRDPAYYEGIVGAGVQPFLTGQLTEPVDRLRIISGNVLTGKAVDPEQGHLGWYDNLITVIEEGDFPEFMGWLVPTYPRPSVSRTMLEGWLWKLGIPVRFHVNTNTHGEERPFVVTGEYEEVLPMNLYPQHLLKAIIVKDLEAMENLGIREVIEEDLALCEFVCTSKIPVQKILREGIEYFRREME